MDFFDALTIDGKPRETRDGYLAFDAKSARTGIQNYLGREMGRPDLSVVRVYRDEAEVFAEDSLKSFAFKPVTNDHPKEPVTSDNWKKLAIGSVGGEIARDGDFVRVPMSLMDRTAIEDVKAGKRELSAGYSCDIDWTAGVTKDGQAYDAIQKNIRINHIAVVDTARGGAQLRIGDGKGTTMSTILIDGLPVEVTDKDAAIINKQIDKLTADAAKVAKDLADAQTGHTTALAAKDEEIGKLKVDLKTAQDAAVKPADLDKLVADRAALVTTVKALDASIKVEGLSDADLRKAAVTAKLGADVVKDASDAEINGMFKAIAKDVKTVDPLANAIGSGVSVGDDNKVVSDAYAQMVKDQQSAYMPKAAH